MSRILAALAGACGDEYAIDLDRTPDGGPRFVVRPADTGEVAAALRVAAAHRLRVAAQGSGGKADWGTPGAPVDLIVQTTRMNRVLEHSAGDLVVRVQAGLPLAALQAACAPAGQMLALDPPQGGTVGGIIATNASGPYRVRYGTCRDLLIGVTVVRADGAIAHSGGKVVKNVAGYDLGKLYTGSFGTLGLITEAVFRLHPSPPSRAAVALVTTDPGAACAAAERVRRSQLAVSALELRVGVAGPLTVTALVEGVDANSTRDRAEAVAALFGSGARIEARTPGWWTTPVWPEGGYGLKIAVRLSRLPEIVDILAGHGGLTLGGSLGCGVLYAGLGAETDPDAVDALAQTLRAALPPADGSAVVLAAPIHYGHDRWGPVAGLGLMRRVKEQFDPHRLLAPGRFVGGI